LTEQVSDFGLFVLQLLGQCGREPAPAGEEPLLRRLGKLTIDKAQNIDVTEAQPTELTQLEELYPGVVFRLDLVRVAIQGQLQGADNIQSSLRRERPP